MNDLGKKKVGNGEVWAVHSGYGIIKYYIDKDGKPNMDKCVGRFNIDENLFVKEIYSDEHIVWDIFNGEGVFGMGLGMSNDIVLSLKKYKEKRSIDKINIRINIAEDIIPTHIKNKNYIFKKGDCFEFSLKHFLDASMKIFVNRRYDTIFRLNPSYEKQRFACLGLLQKGQDCQDCLQQLDETPTSASKPPP